MLKDEMTSKERMEGVLTGKDIDHMPFWPKMTPTYIKFQDKKWHNYTLQEIHEYIGSDF